MLILATLAALWAAGWIASRLALARYGRDAETRKSRLSLHTFLLFHEPIHGLQRARRDIAGILREIRTRKGTRRHIRLQ